MHTQLLGYFQAGNLLTESQSGFRPNHSACTASISAVNLWLTSMDAGKLRACLHGGGGPQISEVTCGMSPHLTCKRDQIKMKDCMDRRVSPPKRVTSPTWSPPPPCKQALNGSVFVELKKAFDTVDHNILLRKLCRYGVSGNVVQLFTSYLADRAHRRSYVNGILSTEQYVSCGILQDSILRPLLFIIYINDFPNCLKHTAPGMCADDTHIAISTTECFLNSELAAVHNWPKTDKLSCNTSKTSCRTIGLRRNLAKAKFMNLKMDDRPIKHKSCTKLLRFILMIR